MKFRVERDVLADAAAWVARSLPARPPVPVLGGVVLEATSGPSGDRLTVSGFDYETSARVADGAVELHPGGRLVVEAGDQEPVAGGAGARLDQHPAEDRNRGSGRQAARNPRSGVGQNVAFDPELHGGEPSHAGGTCSGGRRTSCPRQFCGSSRSS